MHLRVKEVNVVGKKRYYPIDRDGEVILLLMGRKCFTVDEIAHCKELGWTVEYTAEE